jgi:hypothetical protein
MLTEQIALEASVPFGASELNEPDRLLGRLELEHQVELLKPTKARSRPRWSFS